MARGQRFDWLYLETERTTQKKADCQMWEKGNEVSKRSGTAPEEQREPAADMVANDTKSKDIVIALELALASVRVGVDIPRP